MTGWIWVSGPIGMIPLAGDEEDIQKIRLWLEQRPEVQKAVVLEGLARCPESDEFRRTRSRRLESLVWCKPTHPTSAYGAWEQAVSMANERPLAAEHLLEMAFQAHRDHSGHAGLSLQLLQEQARKSLRLRERLNNCSPLRPYTRSTCNTRKSGGRQGGGRTAAVARSMSGPTRRRTCSRTGRRRVLLHHIATLNLEGHAGP